MNRTRFQLDTAVIAQLLGDPGFYMDCVAYSFLRDKGLAASQQLQTCLLHRGDPHLPSEHAARWELGLVVSSFVKHTARLYDMGGPALLQPLRDYLGHRLGCEYEQFLLEYREGPERVELYF